MRIQIPDFCLIVLFTIFNFLSYGQSCTDIEELSRKRHQVAESISDHPFTTFDRRKSKNRYDFNLNDEIIKIRNRIILEKSNSTQIGPIFKAYYELYINAISPFDIVNSDGGMMQTSAPSALARYAKNNAFVYLIGLDSGGNYLDSPTVKTFSPAKRDSFQKRAINSFAYLTASMSGELTHIKFKSKSLIMWLQCYDYLKSASLLPEISAHNRQHYSNNHNCDYGALHCAPRAKLRELTKQLYALSKGTLGINGLSKNGWGWKKNHGLMANSALMTSSAVLCMAGVETEFFNTWYSYIPVVGQIIRIIAQPWPHPKYSPMKWSEFGHEETEDNLFVGKHWGLFSQDVPQAIKNKQPNSYASYAEGPGYYAYVLENQLPAFRTLNNFYPQWSDQGWLRKTEINNMFEWFDRIQMDNNELPSYDNTHAKNKSNLLALTGIPKYNRGILDGLNNGIDLYADYIVAIATHDIPINNASRDEVEEMPDAGSLIVRKIDKDSAHHYFMVLHETGIAEDKSGFEFSFAGIPSFTDPVEFSDGTHEDNDNGSFIISVNDKRSDVGENLAIDPPYFGWGNENYTNRYIHHNVIDLIPYTPHYAHIGVPEKMKNLVTNNGKTSFDYVTDILIDTSLFITNSINRQFNVINKEGIVYYFINDYLNGKVQENSINFIKGFRFNLNGNGSLVEGSCRKRTNLFEWDHPCKNNRQWSLLAHVAALNGNTISLKDTLITNNLTLHGNAGNYICNDIGAYNSHSRLQIEQETDRTIFQSFLYPYQCKDSMSLPTVQKTETSKFVKTIIEFKTVKDSSLAASLYKVNNPTNQILDTMVHLHYAQWKGNNDDTIQNPFERINLANTRLQLNGKRAFIEYHSLPQNYSKNGYCKPSINQIRDIEIDSGTYLIYNNKAYFNSDHLVNVNIINIARHLYSGYITSIGMPSNSDSIRFYLPDVAKGIDMKSNFNGRYDSLTNIFHMIIPNGGPYKFSIEEKNQCLNCYFPPTNEHIDTIFYAHDGNSHQIGHKMKINYPHGQMQITNSTKISMCEGVYLLNKDSLIIEGPPQSKGMVIPSCAGIDSIAKGSKNSMLIVSSGSALVLDAGSRTYVKNGGAIYVKQNGSLVIKDGAFLQIGDSGTGGWGEVIVEAGGDVYIEPYAHIEYRRKIGDTSDINLFSIAVGNNAAYAGVNYMMDSTLKAENIIASTIYPIAICDLDSLNPVVNPEFGYTNFGKPKINIQLRNDTLCPGEPLHISLKRILNDATAKITVCRWDSIFANKKFSHMECVNDSIVLDSIPPDPICRLPRILPEDWTYYFEVNTRHQVTISIMNECGKRHDTSILVVVADTPKFTLTVPATACEGINTVTVLASEISHDSVLYAFEVTEMVDTNSINYQIGNPGEVYSYSNYGILPNTFSFPDYYFKGGRSYLVSLSITNACGTSTKEGEVQIPSGVYIELERSTAYANPVHGARSVQLHGYISSADSFRWEPSTWLNRTDTLVVTSTPEDSICYVLIAKEDNCTALDTVFIRYNHVANAGEGDTVCYTNGKVLLGNPYDLSVFLGFLYYKGGSSFRNEFIANTTADNEYFKQFSLFMHSDLFKSWATNCNTIYTDFTEDLNRAQTIKQPWFINYFELLTRFDNDRMTALDTFTYHINRGDTSLRSNYTNTNNFINYRPCISRMLTYYDDFKLNQLSDVNIAWYKITEEDTSFNGSLQESALAVDKPTKTATYVQQVITPYYAEIDETIVWVDTVMTVFFAPQFQFESTVVFQDLSLPISAGSQFSWNFGDGSPGSTEQFPTHEFAAFDTSFRVCLSITNKCGTQTFCDTVYIDSAHWGGSMYTKGIGSNSQTLNPQSEYGIRALFYPNPTFGNGILAYTIEAPFEKGELKFYDSFGKLVFETSINKASDQVKIPLESYANGLYFYTLQTNTGAYVNGKIVKM